MARDAYEDMRSGNIRPVITDITTVVEAIFAFPVDRSWIVLKSCIDPLSVEDVILNISIKTSVSQSDIVTRGRWIRCETHRDKTKQGIEASDGR